MKKVCIFSIMVFLIAFNGCEKSSESNDSLSLLKSELKILASSNFNSIPDSEPCNDQNPYDNWGQSLFFVVTKLINEPKKWDISQDFRTTLNDALPKDYSKVEADGVDLEIVNLLFKEFLSVFIKRNIFESIQISKKMEYHITQTNYLGKEDKAYLLKLVSILRYSTYLSCSPNIKAGDGSFERCWIGKLQAMEDSGFFEKLSCIYSWPVCFGAMLADCAIKEMRS